MLQAAASGVHPSNLRRGDRRAFVDALGQIWQAAGLEPPELAVSFREFIPQYLAACEINSEGRTIYSNFLNRFAG